MCGYRSALVQLNITGISNTGKPVVQLTKFQQKVEDGHRRPSVDVDAFSMICCDLDL